MRRILTPSEEISSEDGVDVFRQVGVELTGCGLLSGIDVVLAINEGQTMAETSPLSQEGQRDEAIALIRRIGRLVNSIPEGATR